MGHGPKQDVRCRRIKASGGSSGSWAREDPAPMANARDKQRRRSPLRIAGIRPAIQDFGSEEQKSGHGAAALSPERSNQVQFQIGNAAHKFETSILAAAVQRSPATINTCPYSRQS